MNNLGDLQKYKYLYYMFVHLNIEKVIQYECTMLFRINFI